MRKTLAAASLAALNVAAFAQQATSIEGDANNAETTATSPRRADATLDAVVVTGSRTERRSFDLPFSVSTIDAETLRTSGPMINLSEALSRVPGLIVNNRNNYAQDLQVASRGFGARSTFGIRGIRLYTDGIPASMPDGQGQASHFDLAGAERIEVLRGPFSALYGNSSGGVIALYSREPRRTRIESAIDAGSEGLQQYRLSGETRLDSPASGSIQSIHAQLDGFRRHSAASRELVNARLGWSGEDDRIALHVNRIDQRADDPLGLTRTQFAADPRATTAQAEQFDTRKTIDQTQAGLNWRHRLGVDALKEFEVTTYTGRRSVTQWQSIPVATQLNAQNAGGVIAFDRDYAGLDARIRAQLGPIDLTAGVAIDQQDEARRGYENFIGTGASQRLGVTGALRRDENNVVRSVDQYAQAEWALSERWSATVGVRHGHLQFESDDRYLANGDDSGSRDFDYTNPVAGVVYHATDDINLYANAGHGFESPTINELSYRPDGSSGFNNDVSAQRSRQSELGAKIKFGDARIDLAAFVADTDDEIVVRTNSAGRSTYGNAGRTRRQGAELSLLWPFAAQWRLQVALSLLDATYRDAFFTCASTPCLSPDRQVPKGRRIPGVPERSAFVDLGWMPWTHASLGVEWRGVSSVVVDDANSDAASGYGLVALRAEQRFESGPWRARMYARIDNAFDRRHAGSVIVNESNGRYFEPGAPRAWLFGISASLAL